MKYKLTSDDDGHHFIIPTDKQKEWEEYLDLIYSKGEYPDEPEWVIQIDSPERITFDTWEEL